MREHTQLGAGTPHRQAHTAFPQALAQAKSLFELLFGDSDVSTNLWKVGASGQGAKASFSATLHRGVLVVDGRPSEADRPIKGLRRLLLGLRFKRVCEVVWQMKICKGFGSGGRKTGQVS